MTKLSVTINEPHRKNIFSFWIDRCPELRVPLYVGVGVADKQVLYKKYLKRAFNIQKYGPNLLIWLVQMVRCNEKKQPINIIGDCVFCKKHRHAQILIEFVNEHYETLKTLITYLFKEDDPYILPVKLPTLELEKYVSLSIALEKIDGLKEFLE